MQIRNPLASSRNVDGMYFTTIITIQLIVARCSMAVCVDVFSAQIVCQGVKILVKMNLLRSKSQGTHLKLQMKHKKSIRNNWKCKFE